MKKLSYLAMVLLVLPTFSMAAGEIKCGKVKELIMGIEQTCVYNDTSLNGAFVKYFKNKEISKYYKQLRTTNHKMIVGQTKEYIGEIVWTKWYGPNKVEVGIANNGEGDANDVTTFTKVGRQIIIHNTAS